MTRLILTAIATLAALSFGCSQKTVSEGDRAAVDSVLRPDSEVHGATVFLYDRERMTTEIRADLIRRFEAIDSTMGYKLDIDFFDRLGGDPRENGPPGCVRQSGGSHPGLGASRHRISPLESRTGQNRDRCLCQVHPQRQRDDRLGDGGRLGPRAAQDSQSGFRLGDGIGSNNRSVMLIIRS
jgi:hypothetical protein